MKLRRLLPLLLALCLLLPLCLTSCSLIEGVMARDVEFKNLSGYKIVFETDVDGEVFVAVIEMIEAIEEKTGIRLDYSEDFVLTGESVPTETREILIGKTNREESRSHRMGRDDYGVWYENDRLVLGGGTNEAVIKAIGLFLEKYVTEEGVRRPLKECLVLSEYPYADTKLGKHSIYDYVIVRDNTSLAAATALRDAIADRTGAVLDIVTVRQVPEGMPEIAVGNFADEERRSPAAPHDGYAILRDGDRLYLAGDGAAGVYEAVRVFSAAITGEKSKVKLDYSVLAEGVIHEAPLLSLNLPSTLPSIAGKLDLTYSAESVLERFHLTRAELPEEVTVLSRVSLDDYPSSKNTQVFVSPTGREGAKGTQDDPFPTLEAALEYMEGRRGGVIWLRGGTYETESTVTVTADHSGMRQSPLFIKAWEDEEAVLTSNVGLSTDLALWEYLDENGNADVWERIPEEAREEIVYTTLEKQGLELSDIAAITKSGAPRLYVGGEQYTVARYPNSNEPKDLLYFTQVYDTGTVTAVTGSNLYHQWLKRAGEAGIDPKTSIGWEVRVPAGELGEEILSWVNTGDIWFYGSTFEGWEFGYYNLALTDTEGGLAAGETWSHTDPSRPGLKLLGKKKADGGYSLKSKTYNTYGAKHSTNSPAGRNTFYLFNAIEAMDAPGEWFLDRKTGILYMYPTEAFYEPEAPMAVSSPVSRNVLTFNGAKNVVLDGITVDGSNSVGISIAAADNFVVQDVTVRNTRSSCLTVSGGSRNTAVIYSDFSAAYSSMVNLSLGTSYYDMVPSNVVVQNCVFHDAQPTVQTAVSISGCRTVISHNYFHNT
ncbi:MAG: right-handed parallel beta-helix repeat-containing protein [Clostridia bacterium]|nr:right-handed parallel beta-helix repeat-containing protein [Clostridia bacterium]